MNISKKSKLILTLLVILLILNITTIKNTPDYYGSPINQIPNSSASNSFSEDFTTTTFMDSSNTNTSGWGSGKLSLPEKNVTICHFDDGDPYACVKVHVSGDIAFAADKRGMEVYNISNPSSPELINYYDTAFYDVYFTNNYAYVASYSFGFQILSISDPTNIYIVGSNNVYFTDPFFSDRRYADKIIVSGSYAYIYDYYHELIVFSIANPANPVMVGDWHDGSPYLVYDILIRGNHLYLVAGPITIFDITTPTNPIFRSKYAIGSAYEAGAIYGSLLYLGDAYSLDVVDLSNPESPNLINAVSTTFTYARVIYIHNNVLYLGGGRLIGSAHIDGRVEAYNIESPGTPTFKFMYVSPCSIYVGSSLIYSIMISGDYAYMLDFYNEFIVANFNNFNQFEVLGIAQSLTAFSGSDSFLLTKANLSVTSLTPLGTGITYYLSADNGTHWEQVTLGSEHSFNNLGNLMKWKAELFTSDSLVTPELSLISISYKYILKAPNLVTPDNETLSTDNTPYFEWEDLLDAPNYRLQLDTSSSFSSSDLRIINIDTNYWVPSVALDDGIWYWKVAGRDSEGDLGFYSNYRILTIDAPPHSPTLITPSDNLHINTLNPLFSWSSVSDAENYTIDIDTSTSFTSMN
ncbi:MAG: LVIVD repeat-containing protein, partial [Promethearchaeota archaeon]